MEKFFKLHQEKIIGYKALTDADLGLKPTSHQTHIGLFDDVLTFFPNQQLIESYAMFIYEKKADILCVNFDRIQNPDGTFRSPKIRVGGRDVISVVSTIRNIAKTSDRSYTWYLFWFGLESEQVVFWLFNNKSREFSDITNMGLELNRTTKGRIKETDSIFNRILMYFENALDDSTQDILQELEIETQIPGKLITEKKVRSFDIQKAQTIFSEIGRQGEILVAEYFEKLKFDNKIKNYCWVNETSETGQPYDFWYQDLADNIIYLDVKTTKFDFEQRIIFSDKEINFAISKPTGCYNIYRVYSLSDGSADLRICKNCSSYLRSINENILNFQNGLAKLDSCTQSISIAIKPDNSEMFFEPSQHLGV